MRALTTALAGVLATAVPVFAQVPTQPASDLSVHTLTAPGLEVRFVDYHWQPALLEAMAKGTTDVPLAQRNWVIARFILTTRPMTLEGKRLSVGTYLLSLWPNLEGKGMGLQVTQIDMRDHYPNPNVMAPAPAGDVVYTGPARAQTLEPIAPRFDIRSEEAPDGVVLTVSYGNRRFPLKLVR